MDGPSKTSARRRPAIIADRNAKDVPRGLRRSLSLEDFGHHALSYLPVPIVGYIAAAVQTPQAMRNEEEAFRHIARAPRILCDVPDRTPQRTLFGTE